MGVILSVPLRYPVIRPLRDFPELASSPVTIAIQKKVVEEEREEEAAAEEQKEEEKEEKEQREEVDFK